MPFIFGRRHDESEEEDGKRSSKKHRKDKAKDKERATASPAEHPVPEPEEAIEKQQLQADKAGKGQRSDSEEGQL